MSENKIPDAALNILRDRWLPKTDWSLDPVGWVAKTYPEAFLWSKQKELMESVRDYPNTAVKAAHSVSKSFTCSMLTAWWLDSHSPGEAFTISAAPTDKQVKAVLWREINRRFHEGGFKGRTNLTEWYNELNELVAFGRSPNDYDPTALQGVHARYLLVILDEASGISEMLWDAASSLASNENARIVAVGNPDDPNSHFAKVCESPDWNVIKISAFDTPNFTDEYAPQHIREMLVSRRWVEEKSRTWGENSPVYISKVLGEFPKDAEDGVVPFSWASQCKTLELPADYDTCELGLDVAAGGADESVLWLRAGRKAVQKWTSREGDPLKLADWVLTIILQTKATNLKVDSVGVGWGVGGTLDGWFQDGRHECMITPVKVSWTAYDEEHYLNLRSELWWEARERSRQKEWDLGALSDDDLAELTAPRYHVRNSRGRIQIESKDEIRKRIGKSTDSIDALLLSFYVAAWPAVDFVPDIVNTPGGWT